MKKNGRIFAFPKKKKKQKESSKKRKGAFWAEEKKAWCAQVWGRLVVGLGGQWWEGWLVKGLEFLYHRLETWSEQEGAFKSLSKESNQLSILEKIILLPKQRMDLRKTTVEWKSFRLQSTIRPFKYVNCGSWWRTGGLACCGSWGSKESDTTQRLNWTDKGKRRRLFSKSRLILLCAKSAIYRVSFNPHNTFTKYSHFINWGTEKLRNFQMVMGLARSCRLDSKPPTHQLSAQSRQSIKVCLGQVGKCWSPCEKQKQRLLRQLRGQRGDRGTLPHLQSLEVSSSPFVLQRRNTRDTITQRAVSGKIHQNLINWTKGD